MDKDTSQGQYLTPEAILAAQDISTTDVPTPEWGGMVQVRALTMGEVLAIRKAVGMDERQVVIHTLATAFVQPAITLDQAEAMLAKSGAVTQRVLQAVNGLNQVGEAGPEVQAAQGRFPAGSGVPAAADPGQGPVPDQG